MSADIVRGTDYPILKLNVASEITAVTKSDAFTCELTGGDYKTAFIMTASADGTVTFAIGNGIQGAGDDLEVAVTASTPTAIVLDSGYFKNVSGDAKDCVTITPSGSTDFLIVELPQ